MLELKAGIELRGSEYDGSLDFKRYEASIIKYAIKNIAALLYDNRYVIDIIAGWRHGFAPDAVARYILDKAVATEALAGVGSNGYQHHATKTPRELLNVGNNGWGDQYGYTPSVSELAIPAPIVQNDINKRLAEIRTLTIANGSMFSSVPRHLFNEPINNPGIIKHECEVPVVLGFTEKVLTETRKLIHDVFVETV